MSSDTTTASQINYAYGDANNYFNSMTATSGTTVDSNTGSPQLHRYIEFVQNFNEVPPLVNVGCICNSEYSTFAFETAQYWDSDNFNVNIQNAKKMINDLEWAEQSAMHNGSIKMIPGMTVLSKNPDSYIEGNTSFFRNTKSTEGVTSTFNTFNVATGGSGIALDIFGYFHPDVTGNWEFVLQPSYTNNGIYTYLWVGDTAIYDYTVDNANINTRTTQTNGMVRASFSMSKDDFVPIRIQIISKKTNFSGSKITPFSVTPPSNSYIYKTSPSLTDNPVDGWKFFVSFTKNGFAYYKNLLYFGLVQSDNNKDKYNCIFVPTNPNNVSNMITYKDNEKLQYIKVDIPTPTTFSGKGTLKANDGNKISLKLPSFVPITITRAKYCVDNQPDPYTFTVTEQRQVTETVTHPAESITTNVIPSNPNLPTKLTTAGVQEYQTKETKMKDVPITVTSKHSIDVTNKIQTIVDNLGKNKIMIDGQNFANLFGNPVEDSRDPFYNSTKTLIIEYTYSVDVDKIKDKYVFLDPATGLINIGFSFTDYDGTNYSGTSPIKMDTTSSCQSGNCGNYKMALTNEGKLVVLDSGNNNIGNIDLTKFATINKVDPNFNLSKCQKNMNWLSDPNFKSQITANKNDILKQNSGRLVSPDGRFKLEFENDKLTFTYCYIPYVTDSNTKINYTTSFNKNLNNQILYLYRINTRGVLGKKLLLEADTKNNQKTLHYLPNTYNNVLKYTEFYKPTPGNVYPMMYNGEIANKQNYNIQNNISQNDCESKCISDPNYSCEHYFYVSKNNGTSTCYTDKSSDSNPVFTTTKYDDKIDNSYLKKKKYTITTTCGTLDTGRPLQYLPVPNDGYAVNYKQGDNAPNLTYYCGLDRYKQDDNLKTTKYTGGFKESSDTTTPATEGFREYNTDMAGTAQGDPNFRNSAIDINILYDNKFKTLQTKTKTYSGTQDKIGDEYNTTIGHLNRYMTLSNSMASPQYKFSGTDSIIPDKYYNNKDPKPDITLTDGLKKDVGVMLVQQNTMYTLGSIAAATCLILAVVFGGAD